MTLSELKDKCQFGYTGKIPGWVGYLDWNYVTKEIYFHNGDYILNENELKDKIGKRTDLFYIT